MPGTSHQEAPADRRRGRISPGPPARTPPKALSLPSSYGRPDRSVHLFQRRRFAHLNTPSPICLLILLPSLLSYLLNRPIETPHYIRIATTIRVLSTGQYPVRCFRYLQISSREQTQDSQGCRPQLPHHFLASQDNSLLRGLPLPSFFSQGSLEPNYFFLQPSGF
jgi:hypothetical protein